MNLRRVSLLCLALSLVAGCSRTQSNVSNSIAADSVVAGSTIAENAARDSIAKDTIANDTVALDSTTPLEEDLTQASSRILVPSGEGSVGIEFVDGDATNKVVIGPI